MKPAATTGVEKQQATVFTKSVNAILADLRMDLQALVIAADGHLEGSYVVRVAGGLIGVLVWAAPGSQLLMKKDLKHHLSKSFHIH